MTKIETTTQVHNTPLVSRLRAQMLRKGFNPKTLAEKANVGRSFVYDILSGRSCNPTSSKIASIAEELGVSVQYLLSGVHSQDRDLQHTGAGIVNISALKVESSIGTNILVSIADTSSAYYFTEKWVRESLKSTPEALRSVRIHCDSMYPTLKTDDFVLVDVLKKNINPPGVFLLFDGTSLKARRLEMLSPERILVRADNGKYGAYEVAPADLKIIGKIVWVGSSV